MWTDASRSRSARPRLLALVIGVFVLRTSGIYFIMVTLAFAQMVFFVFHDTKIAGGSDGMYIYVRPVAEIAGWQPFTLENFAHFYFVALALFVAGVSAACACCCASPFGRVIVGIRVNEHRMRSLGYRHLPLQAGVLRARGRARRPRGLPRRGAQFGFVNPDMLGWHLSGSVLMMVILGGMGTLSGPIVGAFACAARWRSCSRASPKHWQLLMGGFIVLVALFLPHGLVGLGVLAVRRKVPR